MNGVDFKDQHTRTVIAQAVPASEYYPSAPLPQQQFVSMQPPQFTGPNEVATREFLNTKNWPVGLQNFLLSNVVRMPRRYFICDDSGSMNANDGKLFTGYGEVKKLVSCTRWTEMAESLRFHSSLAQALNTPTEFRLLNSAAPIRIGGPDATPSGLPIFHGLLTGSAGTDYRRTILLHSYPIVSYFPLTV